MRKDTPTPIGKKIHRIRELCGIKQETLALALGMSQQAISKIEQRKCIDDKLLEKIALAMGLTPGIIKNFSEETILYYLKSNLGTPSCSNTTPYSFDPIEKILALYEALLKSEREKVKILEALVELMQKNTQDSHARDSEELYEPAMTAW